MVGWVVDGRGVQTMKDLEFRLIYEKIKT